MSTLLERVAIELARWRYGVATIKPNPVELIEADAILSLVAEDRRELVEACQMARADLMAWAAHDSFDDRDAVQARYADTPAIRAIGAALAFSADGLVEEVMWLLTHNPAHAGTNIAEWNRWECRRDALLARMGGKI